MIKNIVTTQHQLDALYNQSALTWEGLDTSNKCFKQVIEWLKENGALMADDFEPTFHIIKGEYMNSAYGLKGSNAYDPDLNIVAVTGIRQLAITLKRLEVGGRWFDDIVDNNMRRREEQ